MRIRSSRRAAAAAGFSVIEALIAAAILLLVAIGVLPLFVRAMTNNVSGSESTRVSNHGKTQVEQLLQIPFGNPTLEISGGTEKVLPTQYFEDPNPNVDGDERWVTTQTSGLVTKWQSVATVRNYSTRAFDDGVLLPSEALPATVTDVAFKEIEVVVDPTRAGGVLDPAHRITVRFLKSQ